MDILILTIICITALCSLIVPIIGLKNKSKRMPSYPYIAIIFYSIASASVILYISLQAKDIASFIDIGSLLHRLFFVLWLLFSLAIFFYKKNNTSKRILTFSYVIASLAIYLLQFIPDYTLLIKGSNSDPSSVYAIFCIVFSLLIATSMKFMKGK